MARKISIQRKTKSWELGLYFLVVDDYDDELTFSIAKAIMNMIELLERGKISV